MSRIKDPTLLRSQLERISNDALGAVAEEFGQVLRAKIESPEWAWPRQTKRRNGSTVGSPRDIVDSGRLRDSQALVKISNSQYRFEWDPVDPESGYPYGIIAHEGAEGGTSYPARRWTEAALAEFDLEKALAREIAKRV